MNTTETQQRTIETLMQSPMAREALAAAEAERHARRRELLAELDALSRERERALTLAAKPVPALRRALAEARTRLREAEAELHGAEAELLATESGADTQTRPLRRELATLGGDAIEATRRVLLIERRQAANLDDFRAITEPLAVGGVRHSTIRVDNGGRQRLAAIDNALGELDRLALDPAASPQAIEQRCTALRDQAERGMPVPAPGAERVLPREPLAARAGRWVRSLRGAA